jgi:hypothetical protein
MPPSLVFSALISTACGLGFHLLRGGSLTRLIVYVIAAWIGFAIGQVLGSLVGLQLILIGGVHLLEGVAGSLIALVLVARPEE